MDREQRFQRPRLINVQINQTCYPFEASMPTNTRPDSISTTRSRDQSRSTRQIPHLARQLWSLNLVAVGVILVEKAALQPFLRVGLGETLRSAKIILPLSMCYSSPLNKHHWAKKAKSTPPAGGFPCQKNCSHNARTIPSLPAHPRRRSRDSESLTGWSFPSKSKTVLVYSKQKKKRQAIITI